MDAPFVLFFFEILDLFCSLREDETYLLIRTFYERWHQATNECMTTRGTNDESK
jgi:hypothetical protein